MFFLLRGMENRIAALIINVIVNTIVIFATVEKNENNKKGIVDI
jgi:hypothetical protein